MVNVPKMCFTIVHVHKTWYNHGKCPQNVVLPLYMSIKHGITMVNVPKHVIFSIVDVQKHGIPMVDIQKGAVSPLW